MNSEQLNSDALHMAKVSHMVATFAKSSNASTGAVLGGIGGGLVGGIANMKARRDLENQYKTPKSTSNSTNFLLGSLLGGMGGAGAGYLAGGGIQGLRPGSEQVHYVHNGKTKAATGNAINALAHSENAVDGGAANRLLSSMSENTLHPLSVATGGVGLLAANSMGHGPLAHLGRIFSKTKNAREVDGLLAGNTTRTFGTGLTPDKVNHIKTRDPGVKEVIKKIVNETVGPAHPPTPARIQARSRAINELWGKIESALLNKGNVLDKNSPAGQLLGNKDNINAITNAQREGLSKAIVGSAKAKLIPSSLGAFNAYQGSQLLGNLIEAARLRNERKKIQS